jgi:menaquinone-9 beta-reductase
MLTDISHQSSPEYGISEQEVFDVAIVGGGLAGLALSIQLAKNGYQVLVIEKEEYPFHRVCGEYISLESWNFLEQLGYPLSDMNLPIIKELIVSSPNGNCIKASLPLGGFGISRYKIDSELVLIAKQNGVTILEGTKVTDISFHNAYSMVHTSQKNIKARLVAGSFGKRSNLDVKWKRHFISQKNSRLNNYIGIKYHIQTDFPADTIVLHNFSNGYCGMSRIENNTYCLCYLTTASNLQQSGNNIAIMEKEILSKNPFLKEIFTKADFLWKSPVTIAQISFEKKLQVENHVLLLGDAAGMITPLCGNGMSMALHGSKIAADVINRFLSNKISRKELEEQYILQWKSLFGRRLRTGRFIQRLFGKSSVTNLLVSTLKPFPKILTWLIRQTHGQPF